MKWGYLSARVFDMDRLVNRRAGFRRGPGKRELLQLCVLCVRIACQSYVPYFGSVPLRLWPLPCVVIFHSRCHVRADLSAQSLIPCTRCHVLPHYRFHVRVDTWFQHTWFHVLCHWWLHVRGDPSARASCPQAQTKETATDVLIHVLMERSAKLRRLNEWRSTLPLVTQRGLSTMLARAEKGDLPELGATEREIREARDFVVSEATPVGPLLRTLQLQLKPVKREPRGTVGVEVASPMAMLYVACQCKWFGELAQRTYDRDPCSSMAPWQLVFYAYEARPGSKFKSDNKRVVQHIYFTVLNFGAAALAKEDYWLVSGCVKYGLVRQLEGGMSQVMGALLALAFSASGVHLALAGLSVDVPGGRSLRIYARVECLLGDESSLRQVWFCKGASGTKC